MRPCIPGDGGVCVHCGAVVEAGLLRACGVEPTPSPLCRESVGFVEKVKNLAVAAAQHVVAGMPMASDAEIIRRHDICLACEHLQNDACNLCGCPVSRVAGYVSKLSWADQECPIGKWGKATPSG